MGQYSENGCRLASDAAKKRHNNKPVEYCRKHCFESSCIGCVLSGQPKKEVEEMPSGLKECPKCGEQNGSNAKECSECGYDFTTPQGYDGPGSETQSLKETPEVPIVKCHKCDCVIESGTERVKDGEKVLCFDCFEKRKGEAIEAEKKQVEELKIKKPEPVPVKESAPKKAQDTKTRPELLFTIDFPDNTDWELINDVCDPFMQEGYSCTLRGCRLFEFRK